MIKDTKQVKSVNSNSPKKGWKIEWTDGKFDNFFDESWLPILDKAQKTQRSVYIEKEKNQAGYWNIIKLEQGVEPVSIKESISPTVERPPKTEIPGQQIGMTVKEIGDMIRQSKLKEIFGVEATIELVKWYRGQILGTTQIKFDGAKLPSFLKEVQSAKRNVVEEAKKLGAIEIEKGG